MRVVVLYEDSGTVRDAFAARGHDAASLDLRSGRGGGRHIVSEVLAYLATPASQQVDLFIAHPTCTYVAGSGLHWNNVVHGRHACTLYALDHVRKLFAALDVLAATRTLSPYKPPLKYCVENPVGIISTEIRRATQSVQPFNYGEDASKRTCFWLHNLPKLRSTGRAPGRIVDDGRAQLGLFGTGVERWSNQTDSGQNALSPSEDRWSLRSDTYPGIAAAMADQWGA